MPEMPAGNIIAISSLEEFVFKSATLSNEIVPAFDRISCVSTAILTN